MTKYFQNKSYFLEDFFIKIRKSNKTNKCVLLQHLNMENLLLKLSVTLTEEMN